MKDLIADKRDQNAKPIFTTSRDQAAKMTSGELLMQFYVGGSRFLNETFKKMPVLELLFICAVRNNKHYRKA